MTEEELDEVESKDKSGAAAFAVFALCVLAGLLVVKTFDFLENLAQPSFLVTDCAASCLPNHMAKASPYSCICAVE